MIRFFDDLTRLVFGFVLPDGYLDQHARHLPAVAILESAGRTSLPCDTDTAGYIAQSGVRISTNRSGPRNRTRMSSSSVSTRPESGSSLIESMFL